ncbi:AAA family ATPase [Saccharopolyspora hattusasensis]|uniref:ATP-binding protein n=1 Tax=Saccharopolyspora hattusasensis TaxID=1128679 RepID=UPI003D979438
MSRPAVGNIPVDTTSFVGRSRELSEAKSMLARSRLVTLIGVGGVGKTRLALRVAASLPRAFPDGVWLVDLTKMSGPQLLTRTVAEAVEIRESSRRNPLVLLAEHFRDRRALLVLDNCESMSQECAGMANALLKEAPKLRILATSRQRLNIAAEALMHVPPLSEEIAAELMIAVRTAESHVERIFAKRGVTSRAQVATWIIEHARVSED